MGERVSIREFARRIGVSHVAVLGAIRRRVLVDAIVVEGENKFIDVDVGMSEWRRNADESMRRDGRTTSFAPAATNAATKSAARSADDITPESGYQKARTVREIFAARMLRLEYEREAGLLVSVESVQHRIADHVRAALDALAASRRRLAPVLALETDPRKVESILEQSHREVAEAMAGLGPAEIGRGEDSA